MSKPIAQDSPTLRWYLNGGREILNRELIEYAGLSKLFIDNLEIEYPDEVDIKELARIMSRDGVKIEFADNGDIFFVGI